MLLPETMPFFSPMFTNKTVITASLYIDSRSVLGSLAQGDFGHFRSSAQQDDGCI